MVGLEDVPRGQEFLAEFGVGVDGGGGCGGDEVGGGGEGAVGDGVVGRAGEEEGAGGVVRWGRGGESPACAGGSLRTLHGHHGLVAAGGVDDGQAAVDEGDVDGRAVGACGAVAE